MKPTTAISLETYYGNSKCRRLYDVHDMIKDRVNREALSLDTNIKTELRLDKRRHKVQFTEVAKRAFNYNIVKYMLP